MKGLTLICLLTSVCIVRSCLESGCERMGRLGEVAGMI